MSLASVCLTSQQGAQPAKRQYANDGSLESVRGLLYKIAIKMHARVLAMGLSMTFDDVHQEVNLSYLQALEKWDPEKTRFTTYCYTVCQNNVNAVIGKLARERRVLGMVPTSQLLQDTDMVEGDISNMGASGTAVVELARREGDPAVVAHPEDSHDERLGSTPEVALQSRQERDMRIACLSASARRLVGELIRQSELGDEPPSLRAIAVKLQIEGSELTRLKREILKTFGVRWI